MTIKLKSDNNHNKGQQQEQQQHQKEPQHHEVTNQQSPQVQVGSSIQQQHQTSSAPPERNSLQGGGKDIKVEVDSEYLPVLAKKIKKYFDDLNKERQTDGKIHIFEISDCLRKGLLTKQYADEIDNDIYDYMNLIQGLLSEHKLVEILASDQEASSTEYQYNIDFSGISGHPDYIENDEQEWVFELKSTNKIKPLILSDDTVKGYVRQVVYYMILKNIEKGRILVRYNLPHFPQYVKVPDGLKIQLESEGVTLDDNLYKLAFHKDTGQFPFFAIRVHIPLSAPIRDYVKQKLIEIVKPVYESGDATIIPPLEGMKEGTNWKCVKYCKVYEQCKQTPDLNTNQEARYVLLNKHIDEAVERVRFYGRRNKPVSLG